MDYVWDTVRDVSRQPHFLEFVLKTEPLTKVKKGSSLTAIAPENFVYEEGATWKVRSSFHGVEYESIESITSITVVNDENNKPIIRKVQIASQISNFHPGTILTATYTIQPLPNNYQNQDNNNDNDTVASCCCQLKATMAFLPSGCRGYLEHWIRGNRMRASAQAIYYKEIRDYAAEAERRFRLKNNSSAM